MKIQYFADADTLLISLNERPVIETRDLDENTTKALDGEERLVALTLEHPVPTLMPAKSTTSRFQRPFRLPLMRESFDTPQHLDAP